MEGDSVLDDGEASNSSIEIVIDQNSREEEQELGPYPWCVGLRLGEDETWDWVSTGNEPTSNSYNSGYAMYQLNNPPNGRAQGQQWLYNLFMGKFDGWMTGNLSDEYYNSL
ncbi:hypothetical protein VKT23_019895 [Stygiomarasmius scandens]|uniref:Uncharacterized protein n=1 Tax=Marasmiellus scandens TaxID=2682957 RepID=A0ABR1IKG8_9AGAR